MVTRILVFLTLLFMVGASVSPAIAGPGQATAATARQDQADLIIVGKIVGIALDADNVVRATLLPVSTLKGDASLASIQVKIVPSPGSSRKGGAFRTIREGDTALCLMRQLNPSEMEVLPLATGDYGPDDACRKIDSWTSVNRQATPNQNILALLLEHYEGLSSPGFDDDQEIFINLDHSTSATDALGIARKLMSSPVSHRKAVGLAAGIRLGSDDAIAVLDSQLSSLRQLPEFPLIVTSLKTYYKASGSASISALNALVAERSGARGLDAAIAAALERFPRVKDILPTMALLLSGPDSEAQMRAERVFSRYALFADSDGNIGQTIGPLSNDQTRRNAPKYGASAELINEYALFWSSWWSAHRQELGF